MGVGSLPCLPIISGFWASRISGQITALILYRIVRFIIEWFTDEIDLPMPLRSSTVSTLDHIQYKDTEAILSFYCRNGSPTEQPKYLSHHPQPGRLTQKRWSSTWLFQVPGLVSPTICHYPNVSGVPSMLEGGVNHVIEFPAAATPESAWSNHVEV